VEGLNVVRARSEETESVGENKRKQKERKQERFLALQQTVKVLVKLPSKKPPVRICFYSKVSTLQPWQPTT
jgi:hypothetical protein